MTVREACIVAGGAGTRLRPLTATTPKPLLPFCGVPFLSGVIERLAVVGVDRVLLVVGADPTPFEVLRPAAEWLGVTVEVVPEPEPLDTAGGVRAALARVSGAFLVLNGDILTDVPLREVVTTHAASGADATIVLTRVEDTSSFGVCVRDGSRITAFVEKPAPGTLPGQDAVNAGTYVLEPAALERFPEGRLSFERQVFPGLVEAGRHVEGFVSDAVWADLGTPDRYLAGHRLALDGVLAWPPLDAIADRGGGVRVAPDAEVAPDATLHRAGARPPRRADRRRRDRRSVRGRRRPDRRLRGRDGPRLHPRRRRRHRRRRRGPRPAGRPGCARAVGYRPRPRRRPRRRGRGGAGTRRPRRGAYPGRHLRVAVGERDRSGRWRWTHR